MCCGRSAEGDHRTDRFVASSLRCRQPWQNTTEWSTCFVIFYRGISVAAKTKSTTTTSTGNFAVGDNLGVICMTWKAAQRRRTIARENAKVKTFASSRAIFACPSKTTADRNSVVLDDLTTLWHAEIARPWANAMIDACSRRLLWTGLNMKF